LFKSNRLILELFPTKGRAFWDIPNLSHQVKSRCRTYYTILLFNSGEKVIFVWELHLSQFVPFVPHLSTVEPRSVNFSHLLIFRYLYLCTASMIIKIYVLKTKTKSVEIQKIRYDLLSFVGRLRKIHIIYFQYIYNIINVYLRRK